MPPETFVFAPEIETAFVSICFHQPERCGAAYRELDPQVHFIQPHLRHILEAIDLAYRELGVADWPSVIQVLREQGRLEDCGGLDGVNAVYATHIPTPVTGQIFDHYLDLLKDYAVNRKLDPPQKTFRFTGGHGTLAKNKLKTKETEPDLVGYSKVAGRWYKAAGWFRGDSVEFSLVPDA